MRGRVQFTLPRTCDCGAREEVTLEENDIRDGIEGGSDTVAIEASEPFRLTESGQIEYLNCADRNRHLQ